MDECAGDESAALFACREGGESMIFAVSEADDVEVVASELDLVIGGNVVEADCSEKACADSLCRGKASIDDGTGSVIAGFVSGWVDDADAFAKVGYVGLADGFAKDIERA